MEAISANETSRKYRYAHFRAQKRNFDFVKLRFAGKTNLIVDRYSAANNARKATVSFVSMMT
jgi:hypothetical protein